MENSEMSFASSAQDAIFRVVSPSVCITLCVLVFIIIGLLLIWKRSRSTVDYVLQPSLVTPAEKNFYFQLKRQLPSSFQIFAKVRVADVLKVNSKEASKNYNSKFWKISSKHFDFVLVSSRTLNFVCAIELDDRSHERAERSSRDEFLNQICAQSNFSLLRVKATRQYNIELIVQAILQASRS
jgi:hypothetical protein